MNTLYYGDNLDVLRRYVKDETVDLVYLVLFREQDGSRSAAQIRVFEDTWTWDQVAEAAYVEVVEAGGDVADAMRAFRTLLGENDMMAYLAMMAPRLTELQRVLKPAGSIYLHCDPTASHYLKLLMDAIFGAACFQNEIVWSYRRWPSPSNHFQRMHDVLLFYAKERSGPRTFNIEYEANSPSYVKRFKGKTQMLDPETRTRKITLDKESRGLPRRDVWELSIIAGVGRERLGYPTQKPEALLERIILASSNPGDLVLDPFCGCGTTIAVAQRLNRRWIGIDVTHLAITLIRHRLHGAYGRRAVYKVTGEPVSLPDARALAEQDKYQFQWWSLGLVGARPTEQKKGADQGIDGRLYFIEGRTAGEGGNGTKTKQIVFSVKSGHLQPSYVRDLRGVVEREGAVIGVLITLEEPTKQMRSEAATAGFYTSPWGRHPRIQVLTVEELLNDKRVDAPPPGQVSVTFKKPPKVVPAAPEQLKIAEAEAVPWQLRPPAAQRRLAKAPSRSERAPARRRRGRVS